MKRDGALSSLWQATVEDFSAKENATNKEVDVLIVGGGVTGITTALLLQKAGKTCIVAEAHNLCFGTTGGTTSHLNTFFDTTYDQIISDFGEDNAQLVGRATQRALAQYKKHVDEYAIDCGFEVKDGYLFAQNEEQEEQLMKLVDATKRAGVAVEYSDRTPVPVPFTKAAIFPGQAQVHATRYVHSLAKAFEEAGGIILQQCLVDKFENNDGVLTVETGKGQIIAKNLVWATHIPPGINLLHFRCAPYRSYAAAFKLQDDAYPDGLAYDMYDPYHYYRTQIIDGEKYLIVGGEDHKTAHVQNTEACFNQLEAHVRQFFNVDRAAYKWSSQYFEPSDGLAYIGHLPGNPDNVYVATGYSGNGMTYSHIAAITLTDLITKGESEYATLFAPGRVKPVAGFAAFVKENADVVGQFFSKRFSTQSLSELTDIPKGEGRLVKYEGESIALYRDEDGNLHAVDPVCKHAKCVVDWNSAEKSWDCPCHGARYSVDGELLTGPARHGLTKINLQDLVDDE